MAEDWLEIPGLHDAELSSIQLSRGGELTLDFGRRDGSGVRLEVAGTAKPVLTGSGVLLPMIISSARWIDGPDLDLLYRRMPGLANSASYICRHSACLEFLPNYGETFYIFLQNGDPDSLQWTRIGAPAV